MSTAPFSFVHEGAFLRESAPAETKDAPLLSQGTWLGSPELARGEIEHATAISLHRAADGEVAARAFV